MGSAPISAAMAGREVEITEESRFSMNRAEATTSGMILPGRSGISDDLEIGGVPLGFWILRVHFLELAANDASDRGVAHPVAVGRYHMPWRPFGGTAGERDLIGRLVILPKLAVVEIGEVELPLLLRIFHPFRQALFLFLGRDVEHELQNRDAVLDEVLFELIDLIVALFDHARRYQILHLSDEHVFIMRPIENAD